jgi:hypothetical protein
MFTVHCENIVRAAATRKTTPGSPVAEGVLPHTFTTRIASLFGGGSTQLAFLGSRHGSTSPSSASNMEGPRTPRRLRPDMIRRVDDAPKLVNPSGWISEGQAGPTNVHSMDQSDNWESSTAPRDPQLPLQESGSSVSSGQSRVGRPLKRRS